MTDLRYSRNVLLDGIGEEGQRRLSESVVAIVGAGALGSIAALYLAGSGVGEIRLADFDTVDVTNLQRQPAFTIADVGLSKADTLAARLRALNPAVRVTVSRHLITRTEAPAFLAGSDVAVEASDNPATKHLVSAAALAPGASRFCVVGGVSGWSGQVTTCICGVTTPYCDIFPAAADPGGYTPCSAGGILGPLPGIVGSLMAAEAIKVITGAGTPLCDRLWTIDALTLRTAVIPVVG